MATSEIARAPSLPNEEMHDDLRQHAYNKAQNAITDVVGLAPTTAMRAALCLSFTFDAACAAAVTLRVGAGLSCADMEDVEALALKLLACAQLYGQGGNEQYADSGGAIMHDLFAESNELKG